MLLNCGVGEDSWESLCSHLLADCKKIKPVNPKGNHSWIFIGRTDVEAETPILWPPDGKNWLIGKDSDTGKDWRQVEKGMTEDEMDCILDSMDMSLSKRPELMMDRKCCSPWGCKESDMTESPTWTEWQTWKLYLCVAATAKSLQSCLTLCDHIDSSPPGTPVHHQLPEFTQTHVHWVCDAIQPSHSVLSFSSCLQSFPASRSFLMS